MELSRSQFSFSFFFFFFSLHNVLFKAFSHLNRELKTYSLGLGY